MTRARLIAAALGAGAAFAVLPAAPATALCEPLTYELTGRCLSPCAPVNAVLTRYGTHLDCVQ